MPLSRLTVGKVVLAWAVFLLGAALILPQLGPQTQAQPAVKAVVATIFALLLIGTPIALITYFNRAWRKIGTVPNRAAYVIWLSLESMAGVAVLAVLGYAALISAIRLLR